MNATARDAAFAWLEVARAAIERAAECAVAGHIESLEEYQRLRAELDEQIIEAHYELQLAEVTHRALARDRGLHDEEAA